MPSTYAHYRMGQEVRADVGECEKHVIEHALELFNIGLHGPDILFYYKPLKSNPVNRIGYGMHERSGQEFFERAAQVIRAHPGEDAYLAYLYGFLCHFALDTTCHGYIDEKIESSGVSHAEIEVEFDRMLMLTDGYDPVRHHLTGHIVPSLENARIIREFFKGVTAEEVQKALAGMIKNNELLLAPSAAKRILIKLLLALSGNYKEMHGLMVNITPNPKCVDSNEKLYSLYCQAEKTAVRLIEEYGDFMKGAGKRDPIYRYSFGSKLIEGGEEQ